MPGEIDRTLVNFLRAVRGADVRVSVAETLDAVEVARFVGWENRDALKQGLGLALAKTVEEKTRFDATFDAFFSAVANTADTEDEFDQSEETSSSDDVDDHLARLLLDGDRAELIAALEEAAAAVDLNEIRFFTQRGLYTQRILREMGVEGLDAAIREAQQAGGVGDGLGNGQGSGQRPGLAGDLEAARARLFESAKDLVERRL